MKDLGKRLQASTELLISLDQLDPDGNALAEGWLEKFGAPAYRGLHSPLKARAMLLGAWAGQVSRPTGLRVVISREWTRCSARSIPERKSVSKTSRIGSRHWAHSGLAGRLAIPRLNELGKHSIPWVRMWAAERARTNHGATSTGRDNRPETLRPRRQIDAAMPDLVS